MIDRLAIIYITFGVPTLLAAMQLTHNTAFTLAALGGIAVLCGFVLLRVLTGQGAAVPISLYFGYALLWIVLLAATFNSQLFLPQISDALQFKALASAFAWSAVALVVPQMIRHEGDLGFFGRALAISGLVIAATVFASAAFGFGEVYTFHAGEVRAFGPLGDQVGFVLAFFAVFAAARRSYLELAVHAVAIMLTGTRAAVVLLAIALLLVFWARSGEAMSFRRIFTWMARVVGAAALFVLVLLSPAGQFVFQRFTNPELMAITIAERFGAVTLAIDIVREHPVIGVGYNGYAKIVSGLIDPFSALSETLQGNVAYASNQFVQTATDAGFIGVAVLLLHIALVVQFAWRGGSGPSGRPLLAATFAWCLAFVLVNQTACWLIPDNLSAFLWFALMGGAGAAWRLDRARE